MGAALADWRHDEETSWMFEDMSVFNKSQFWFLSTFFLNGWDLASQLYSWNQRRSMWWTADGEIVPKEAKTVSSVGKVLTSVFWDQNETIHVGYLPNEKTITGACYAEVFNTVGEKLSKKWKHFQKTKNFFPHDNAPVRTSKSTEAKFQSLCSEIVPQAPYSPDLIFSDLFLFPKLKWYLSWWRYGSKHEVMSAAGGFFEDHEENFFSDGSKALQHWVL